MAKMLLNMNGAEGRVGNTTYYRANGKTISREIVTPKNPQTTLQTYQRVIMKQVGKSYAKLKDICNHSFEGYTNGAECSNRFRQLNARYLRSRASELQQAGQSLANFYNFMPINSDKWVPGAAIISQGSLPQVGVSIIGTAPIHAYVPVPGSTYADIINAYRLKRGDQLTFVTVERDAFGDYNVYKARVILDPRNSDGSGAPLTSEFVTEQGGIENPNFRNETTGAYFKIDENGLGFDLDSDATLVAAAVIVSRRDTKGYYYRSNAQLVIDEGALGSDLCSLEAAVSDSYNSSPLYAADDLYLNNSGEGGSQGTNDPGTPSVTTVYSNTVEFDGVSQDISGGSVNVGSPLGRIVVRGTGMLNSNLYLTINNGSQIQPATKTGTSATFNVNAADGSTVRVYKDGNLWFTVNVQSGLEIPEDNTTPNVTSVSVAGNAKTLHQIGDENIPVAFNNTTGLLTIQGNNLDSIDNPLTITQGDSELDVTVNESGTVATATITDASELVTAIMGNTPLLGLVPTPTVTVGGSAVTLQQYGDGFVADVESRGAVTVRSDLVAEVYQVTLNEASMTVEDDLASGSWLDVESAVIAFEGWSVIQLNYVGS